MKFCARVILVGVILSWSTSLGAHGVHTALFRLVVSERDAALLIRFPTEATASCLPKRSADDGKQKEVTIEEEKRKLVRYLKDHVVLAQEGKQIQMKDGALRLGKQQVDVVFKLSSFAPERALRVEIHAFEDQPQQRNLFRLVRNGQVEHRLSLSSRNDYSGIVPPAGLRASEP